MSLHYLGISQFPVLHRQFSSPTAIGFSESSLHEDVTQDNKDVLIDRLNDLVSHLSRKDSLEDTTVTAIHSEVDRIEVLMRGKEGTPQSRNGGFEMKQPKEDGEDAFWGPPLSPSRSIRMRMPERATLSPRSTRLQITPSRATDIAKAAEDLCTSLAATLSELQTRKEESDHVHDLLITRAENAAERILLLEYRIGEMEEDFEANQSELRFLRIQLQAIEAQCAQYIPRNKDEELTQSIMNWKVDWEDIDRRSKARRKKLRDSISSLTSAHTAVDA